MTEQSNRPDSINAQSSAKGEVSTGRDSNSAQTPPESTTAPPAPQKSPWKRKLLAGVLVVAVLAVVLVFGIPRVREMLNTVSTDDAYVNGHVTFVAPRVAGQISRVLVDDNNRVRKGDLLAELDKEPYRVEVSEKQAEVDTANADLQAATATARAIEAQAWSQRWSLERAVEGVDSQVALLRERIADVDKAKAALVLAQLEFDRAKQLVVNANVSRAGAAGAT
jgi:membrane fusion protein (multidrug efflux system)